MRFNHSDAQRIAGWLTGLRALKNHPARWLFGWGPETFPIAYRLHRTPHAYQVFGGSADHAHNIFLELLVTLGLAGTAAVAYLLYKLWRSCDDVGKATMLGVLVIALVEPIPWQAWGLMCMIVGSRQVRAYTDHEGPSRLAAITATSTVAALIAAFLWASDFCTYKSEMALRANNTPAAASYAKWAASFNPASVAALHAQAFAGVYEEDMLTRASFFHPQDGDADQLAVITALALKRPVLALYYARRAAEDDPANADVLSQTAYFESRLAAP